MLHKGYYRKSSVKKISCRGSQGAWDQDELIGGKPPVVKYLLLWFWLWLDFSSSHRWGTVSQGHKAVMEKSLKYKDEIGASPSWIVKISWVQIRTEEYRVIKDEVTRRLYSDWSYNFYVEIRCQETTSGN
jgi:hypothetical protein